MLDDQLPVVAIVGRPNVGKSTLFNRIVGRRQAIVGRVSGLTRDRHEARAEWGGRPFRVVDTGGVQWDAADALLAKVQTHALRAVEGAAVAVWVVDARDGLTAAEERFAEELRRCGRPVLLAVNKCDTPASSTAAAAEFHRLGFEPVLALSAEHGHGVADLLDRVVERLDEEPAVGGTPATAPPAERAVRVAVVGRPNVGKSSLVNALLGQERVLVSDLAGTTRDAIDTLLERDGRPYVLIDTAGIRRGGRREGFAEAVSVAIARQRMSSADVALLVVDAAEGLSRQDVAVADEARRSGCGLIVAVNKWDLIGAAAGSPNEWVAQLRARMGRIGFGLFTFVSARTGAGVDELFPLIDRVAGCRRRRVPTAELNAFFEALQRRGWQGPPGSPRLKYITQAGVAPPRFVVFVGGRGRVDAGYRRYLENQLREAFDFTGSPIIVRFRR